MTISANFPHQLALMLVALQTDKLPICEHLSDPTEKSLVGSLMTYLNNRDFRTPITIARKTLGTQIRVKRSTLFNKLRSLKEKGLIEDVTGELPIRFTEKAIALMHLDWTKQADRWKESKSNKNKTFRVGKSVFPESLIKLINRGVSESQLRGLLSEAKKAGRKIQDILLQFESSLSKYEGKILFLVIRDILRKPEKYQKTDKITVGAGKSSCDIKDHEVDALRIAAKNDIYLLTEGEQLQEVAGRVLYTSKDGSYQNADCDSHIASMIIQRMKNAVLAYAQREPDWIIRAGMGLEFKFDTEATRTECRPIARDLRNGAKKVATWHDLFAAIPEADKTTTFEPKKDKRVGRQLLRRGVSYLVDTIAAGVASLRVLSGEQSGRVCSVPVDNLDDPEIAWVRL